MIDEIEGSSRKISLKNTIFWTFGFIVLYCCLINIGLVGILRVEGLNPFSGFRIILASRNGTLLELGIYPFILTTILHKY